jgi:hypothetical protein
MNFAKLMLIVVLTVGALSLGACAQKKEMAPPPPANTGYSK